MPLPFGLPSTLLCSLFHFAVCPILCHLTHLAIGLNYSLLCFTPPSAMLYCTLPSVPLLPQLHSALSSILPSAPVCPLLHSDLCSTLSSPPLCPLSHSALSFTLLLLHSDLSHSLPSAPLCPLLHSALSSTVPSPSLFYAPLCRWFRFAQLAKGKKFRP
jgi:hypothetical protein